MNNKLSVSIKGKVVRNKKKEDWWGYNYVQLEVGIEGGDHPEFYIGHGWVMRVIINTLKGGDGFADGSYIDGVYNRGFANASWNLLSMLSGEDWYEKLKKIGEEAWLTNKKEFTLHFDIL